MANLSLLLALGLSLGLPDEPARPEREEATIRMVVNTNTVVVATVDDPMLWVTLLGVGTPETVDPLKPDFLLGKTDPKWLAAWLAPGTRALMERRGETVSGRPLVLLYRLQDELCWNAHLVRVGAAFAARQAVFPEFGKLASMEDDAQRRGLGLWKGYTFIEPTRPAREPAPVVADHVAARSSIQRLDPAHFPRPVKRRYASQAAVREQVGMMMGSMVSQYAQSSPPQMNHVNASYFMMQGGSAGPASGSGYYQGPRQPPGYYFGGVGSSHRGGKYINPFTNNHYQKRR